ncbi:MAG: hypothetical protein NVV72_11515 [Asticcacaulis sp.]|nr:hypothetical protein [Asticcacaulis sp.]
MIDGMPAEVALNPEAVEGNPARERPFNGNGHGGEAREGRRNRRPRRGERARPEVSDSDDEPAADGLVATRRAARLFRRRSQRRRSPPTTPRKTATPRWSTPTTREIHTVYGWFEAAGVERSPPLFCF